MKKIAILGSTGSIGTQTLDIVREKRNEFSVVAVAARKNSQLVEKQIREFGIPLAAMYEEEAARDLRERCSDLEVKILSGMEGLLEVARAEESQVLVTGIVGMIGIRPTIAAIEAGKDIALANKETLVCAGHIIMPLAKKMCVDILPVDSEHSAIFQSMNGFWAKDPMHHRQIEKILLTASGGPFRGKSRQELMNVSLEAVLKHPNWDMGPKVTIDSASLVNKGLELMEACWLFDVSPEQVEILIHPQSILHSAVQFVDGGIIGQMGVPDMKLPIQYALTYPDREYLGAGRVDFFSLGQLTFEKPDEETFRGLALAKRAAAEGGILPTVFNAANEAAVRRLLQGEISFLEIPDIIEKAMDAFTNKSDPAVEDILEAERATGELLRK